MAADARGHNRTAHRAAAALMAPSTRTGTRYNAPPRNTPQSPARSNPPTLDRTSTGSETSGRLTARAFSMAFRFRISPSSESPAPRPANPCGSLRSNVQVTAVAVVVLPMPISPVAKRWIPAFFCCRTRSIPARIACSAWQYDIAGPCVISAVPLPIRQGYTPGCEAKSRIPISTGSTLQDARAAIRQTLLWPAARARATIPVTSLPD